MHDIALISADQTWLLLAILLTAAAVGLWADRQRWGSRISGAVVSILITFVLTNTGIVPVAAPLYDQVWGIAVPLAIPLLLLRADLRRIAREAGPMLLAFLIGATGTVAGVLLMRHVLDLGTLDAQLSAVFAATYIGGSMNFAATAQAVELTDGAILSAAVAADNLLMTLFFIVLFALPGIPAIAGRFPAPAARIAQLSPMQARAPDTGSLANGLAFAATVCAIGFTVQAWSGVRGSAILVITVLSVALATARPATATRLTAAEPFGYLLMQVFFATIGASANIWVAMSAGPTVFFLAAGVLSVHLLVTLVGGRIAGLSLPELVVASNANLGGPTTAAAMAAGKHWPGLVTPAVLVGTLGYAAGTLVGVTLAGLLG